MDGSPEYTERVALARPRVPSGWAAVLLLVLIGPVLATPRRARVTPRPVWAEPGDLREPGEPGGEAQAAQLPGSLRADTPSEREWRRRRWALTTEDCAPELAAALIHPDWRDRHDALDALARNVPATVWASQGERAQLVVDLTVDPHPSVRAQAITLADRAGLLREALARHGAQLAGEVFPDARLRLARALSDPLIGGPRVGDPSMARTATGGTALSAAQRERIWDALVAWEASPDEELSRAAFVALVGNGMWPAERILTWIFRRVSGRTERFRSALAVLERGGLAGAGTDGRVRVSEWRAALEREDHLRAALPALEMMALRTGHGGDAERLEADLPALCAHDTWREALAQTARVRPPGLDRVLWRAVERTSERSSRASAERREFLVECASEASLPWDALAQARSLSLEPALAVWQTVQSRMASWDPEGGAYWLAPQRSATLRMVAARALGTVLGEDSSPSTLDALFALAVDPDERLREFAFRRLCDLQVSLDGVRRLREAWATYDVAEQLERLRDLPRRTAPVALRADLLGLGAHGATRSMSVIELLGLFEGDAEVAATLGEWLEAALADLDRTSAEDQALRTRERRARALAISVARCARRSDPEWLSGVLGTTLDRAVAWVERNRVPTLELAETAAATLGALPCGAPYLLPHLAAAPGRVRVEVALGLARDAQHADEAQGFLADRYPRLDGELRTRVLAVAGEVPSAAGLALLARVAADPLEDWEQRFGALNGLARHGELEQLQSIYAAAREVDVRLACLGALAGVPGEATRGFLVERLTELAPTGFAARPRDLSEEEHALLVDEVLLRLAARGELQGEHLALWLQRARASALPDLEARFADRFLPRADFRWRTELALVRHLAQSDQLAVALELAGPWYTLDADLLLAMAEAVRSTQPSIAADLLRAAVVAYAGQQDSQQVRGKVLAAQLHLAQLSGELERPAECAGWSRRLVAADRLGADLLPLLERRFGSRDQARGIDPRARLASSTEQAAALAALARGDARLAREHLERARWQLGFSRAAAQAQSRLAEILSASGDR